MTGARIACCLVLIGTSKHGVPSPRVSLMPWNLNYPMSATVTVHRVGLLDLTSIIERTIPATANPFNVNIAFSPRYWA
jgi:hypothetical protein